MRVSKRSNSVSVAGAVAGKLRSGSTTTLEAIGLEATHQAITAIINATRFLADDGIQPVVTMTSEPRIVAGQERQAVLLTVKGERLHE